MFHAPSLPAQAECRTLGSPAMPLPLRRLRCCVDLHTSINGEPLSTVTSVPSILKDDVLCLPVKDGICTASSGAAHASATGGLPSNSGSNVFVKVMQPMRVCILWPALQEPPAWLTGAYDLVKGAEVQVRWRFCLRQRVWLNFTNQRRPYHKQALTVWQAHRPLSSGVELSLPVPANSSACAGSGAPVFGYVLCLCAVRGAGGGLGRAASMATQLMHSKDSNPATATLQQIYTNIEEGVLDPSSLGAATARDLLNRVMLAGDDELLLMLVEAGVGTVLSPMSLQQLLQYAMLEELPWLAQLVVQSTEVELTPEVLQWLVQQLLCAGSTAQAEQFLGQYCIGRRNPLSTVSAMKEAIMQVVSASQALAQQQDMFRLAVKFRGAVYSLLQDLLQQHAGLQLDETMSGSVHTLNLADVPVEPLLRRLQQQQQQQQQHELQPQPRPPCRTQQPSMQSVQAMLADCLEERVTKYVGRSNGKGTSSIHDASPYTVALRMRDAAFFRLPAVLAHTQRLWQGTELERMQALAHGSSMVADEQLPGAKHSAWNVKRHLGRGRAKLMSIAAFKGISGTADSSSRAVGFSAGSSSSKDTEGRWLSSVLEVSDAVTGPTRVRPATAGAAGAGADGGTLLVQGLCGSAAGSTGAVLQAAADNAAASYAHRADPGCSSSWHHATGDGSCCLSVSAPGCMGATGTAYAAPLPTAVSQHHNLQPAADARQGPGPCAEGVEFQSMADCSSSAASSRRSSETDGHGSSSSTAASVLRSFSLKRQQQHDDPWLNSGVGLELMQNMGLAGSGSQPFAWAASVLLHTALLAPRALYNSPRGRWLMRCLFEAMFLTLYQVAMMGYVRPLFAGHRWWVICFIALVAGNTTDVLFQLRYQHHNNIRRYLSDHAAKVDVLVNFGLLGLMLASVEKLTSHSSHSLEDELSEQAGSLAFAGLSWMWIAASACAVLVWARALYIILPLSAGLGAMLCTVRKAAEEAAVLVPVLVVMVLGFGTTLNAVYKDIIPDHNSLAGSLRTLIGITGGDLNLKEFETSAEGNTFLAVWGQVVEIAYICGVNVLLMTLLIAIINQTYQPEFIEKETVVMHAKAVEHYHHQVRHGLAPAPANILQMLLLWLPCGFRTRAPCFQTLWLPFGLDGYTPAAAASAPDLLIATGPAEVGWLAFHITVFPIASVLALLSLLVHVPFGVVWFAWQGHRMWLIDNWSVRAVEPEPSSVPASGRTSTDDAALRGSPVNKRASIDMQQNMRRLAWHNAAAASPAGRPAAAQQQRTRRASVLGLVAAGSMDLAGAVSTAAGVTASTPLRVAFAGNRVQPFKGSLLVPGHKPAPKFICGLTAVRMLQSAWWWVHDALVSGAVMLLAAAVGLFAHVVLLVVLALVLCWTFVTRLLYALWCIFIPAAANHSVSLPSIRRADYWSKSSIQAAFACFIGVSVSAPQQQQHTQQEQQEQQAPSGEQQLHQASTPQAGCTGACAQDVWNSLGSSGRLSARGCSGAGGNPHMRSSAAQRHWKSLLPATMQVVTASSRAAASLQPLKPQLISSTGQEVQFSLSEALVAEELQRHVIADHQQQQQQQNQQPRASATGSGVSPRCSFPALEDNAADAAYDEAMQYIAALTGLQPVRGPVGATPQPLVPVEQAQAISHISSSLPPQ